MRVMGRLRAALRAGTVPDRDRPRCEGRVLHLVGDNPGGEAVRVAAMGRTVVKILDRRVFERACAAAVGAGRDA